MRKTTEELARACGDDWDSTLREDKEFMERFRRLVIENERESAEAVGVTASLPGTNNGYTFVAFNGYDVPVGTKLFTLPPAAIDRDSVIEALQLAHDHMRLYLPHYTEKHNVFDTVTRALKSQLAALDPRAEALRIARAALDELSKLGNGKLVGNSVGNVLASEALAAIDKVLKGGE